MTEDQIEQQVERLMNRLDRHLMSNLFTQDEYDREVYLLDIWAQKQYKKASDDNSGWNPVY